MDNARELRLQEIRSRQQNWMKQRESALEREKVEQEILDSRASSFDAPSSSSSASRPSGHRGDRDLDRTVERVAPEELVDALTIRLAEKIKAELQLEDRAELGKVQAKVQREKANVNKLEGYLAKEIASHKCPICYELMVPPNNSPLLLFPCGHTFCSTCLKTHEKYNRRKCPYCRQKIESTAANISLQQLIQNYVQQKRRLVQKTGGGSKSRGGNGDQHMDDDAEEERKLFEETLEGDGIPLIETDEDESDGEEETAAQRYESYATQYRNVEMRVKILENELLDTKEEQMQFDQDLEAANKVLEHLIREKQKCLKEEELILKMKRMIQDQLQMQEKKLKQITQEKDTCSARSSLIVETLKPLTNELDKLRLLIEGIGQADA